MGKQMGNLGGDMRAIKWEFWKQTWNKTTDSNWQKTTKTSGHRFWKLQWHLRLTDFIKYHVPKSLQKVYQVQQHKGDSKENILDQSIVNFRETFQYTKWFSDSAQWKRDHLEVCKTQQIDMSHTTNTCNNTMRGQKMQSIKSPSAGEMAALQRTCVWVPAPYCNSSLGGHPLLAAQAFFPHRHKCRQTPTYKNKLKGGGKRLQTVYANNGGTCL